MFVSSHKKVSYRIPFLLFLVIMSAFTSAISLFLQHLKLYSIISEKRFLSQTFLFLTDLPKPPHPFNGQNLPSMTKVFCWCSLHWQISISNFWQIVLLCKMYRKSKPLFTINNSSTSNFTSYSISFSLESSLLHLFVKAFVYILHLFLLFCFWKNFRSLLHHLFRFLWNLPSQHFRVNNGNKWNM